MDITTEFSIIVSLIIFVIFFILGYLSFKRSGGFFLILAGFTLIGLSITAYEVLGAVSGILSLFSCFILLSGVLKAFYNKNAQAETGNIKS